uniref:Calcineurin B-like protein n=1 Tax=Populus trichocarpa TaxID=3694 RepID=A0A3N7EP41_POPTR
MDRSSSSLEISERICAVFIPLIGIIQAVVLSFIACFDRHLPPKKLQYTIDDLRRIASNSLFTVNEVEALLELFKKLSSSVIDDGLIHKEDLKLALLKTPAGDNLILDRVRQMLNAILLESGLQISEESLEVIIDKTFADADADKDGKINKVEWKAFATQHPNLLKNMTLPYLRDITTMFPSFIFNTEVED